MPHALWIKRLFKRKSFLVPSAESSTQNQLAVSSLQKFKVSSRSRFHTLKANFNIRTAAPQPVVEDSAIDAIDLSQYLPVVDDIGADLGLTFSNHDIEGLSTLSSLQIEHIEVGFFHCQTCLENRLMANQVDNLPRESVRLVQSATRDNDIHVRTEVTIISSAQGPLQEVRHPQDSFVDVVHGSTTASIIAVPRSVSIERSKPERNSPRPHASSETAPASPNVLVCSFDSSSSGNNDGDVSMEPADQDSGLPEPEVSLNATTALVLNRLTSSIE